MLVVLLALLITQPVGAQQATGSTDSEALGKSWDGAYLNPDFNLEPNAFLVAVTKDLKPGDALDVGMGQGRNAIFLAGQGWNVTGFDVSRVGVTQARERAQASQLKLNALRQTAADFDWGTNRWDLIVVMYFPGLWPYLQQITRSLKPGGVVVVEAYHADATLDKPPGPGAGVRFESNELLTLFAPFRILRYEDVRARADWGMYDTRMVRLLARKRE
jgi:SAM-dependent methyltransferase